MPPRPPVHKQSYTVPCPSAFRDAVEALAAKRGVNVGDLARSILLVAPPAAVEAFADPGEPERADREAVVLKSGPGAGRPWRRKPRLQVRLVPGYPIPTVRRALALALALASGTLALRVADPEAEQHLGGQIERLRAAMEALCIQPLADGVRTLDEALHVLGFPPGARPDERAVRARFRVLATIHHPDGEFGNHERMSQLNAAMDLLRRP